MELNGICSSCGRPDKCTPIISAGALYVETVITYKKVFVNHVNILKPEKPLKH